MSAERATDTGCAACGDTSSFWLWRCTHCHLELCRACMELEAHDCIALYAMCGDGNDR